MKLTQFSKNKLYQSFSDYDVGKEFADPIYNYLVHGLNPGKFFTSLLANDCTGTISHSHPANTIGSLKSLCTWLDNEMPSVSWGDCAAVCAWLKTPATARREILEMGQFIYTEKEEVVLILKGEKTTEPLFY